MFCSPSVSKDWTKYQSSLLRTLTVMLNAITVHTCERTHYGMFTWGQLRRAAREKLRCIHCIIQYAYAYIYWWLWRVDSYYDVVFSQGEQTVSHACKVFNLFLYKTWSYAEYNSRSLLTAFRKSRSRYFNIRNNTFVIFSLIEINTNRS